MEAISELFCPYCPKAIYMRPEFQPMIRDFSKWKRTNIATDNVDELIFNCFTFALDHIEIPERIDDCYSDLWSADVNSTLRQMLTYDMLVASIVYMRSKVKAPEYSLAQLMEYCSDSDYSNLAKNLREFVPPKLQELLEITQVSGGYAIHTHYPNLVAAIIKNAKSGCLSQKSSTRSSYKYNKRFFQDSMEAIFGSETKSPSYPDEEFYIFERLFSLRGRLQIFPSEYDIKKAGNLPRQAQYLPNVLNGCTFLNALLEDVARKHINAKNALAILKFMGGYFYPLCQALLCAVLQKQCRDDRQQMILHIQDSSAYKSIILDEKRVSNWLSKQQDPTRTENHNAGQILKRWDVDWWSGKPVVALLSGNLNASDGPLLFASPIFDLNLISECLYLE